MSNAVFPSLPGLTWSVTKTPTWSTKVQRAVSGREQRVALMSAPLYKIQLVYSVLRGGNVNGYTELEELLGFFLARQGSFDNFLFTDVTDDSVTNQNFGTGDGTTASFQLQRTYGAGGFTFTEPVANVNGAPAIYVGGVLQASYTMSTTGVVTLTSAPAVGVPVTWTGSFYYRCRFDADTADFEEFMSNLWALKKCDLIGSLGVKI